MTGISFFVAGEAKPQGSKKAMMPKNARFPVVVESAGEPLKHWRAAIRYAAQQTGQQIAGSVAVELVFTFPRPKSHFGSGRNAGVVKNSAPINHVTKPDVDKLARAVLDSLTNVVIQDDSNVVSLTAGKRYADHGSVVGCHVKVRTA